MATLTACKRSGLARAMTVLMSQLMSQLMSKMLTKSVTALVGVTVLLAAGCYGPPAEPGYQPPGEDAQAALEVLQGYLTRRKQQNAAEQFTVVKIDGEFIFCWQGESTRYFHLRDQNGAWIIREATEDPLAKKSSAQP